ncbi:hypothetical protein MEQU1_000257 [Malassezia equina]|uniref:Dynein heavy chain, cytoplasmic n=1 Tax=Malassezia equina TaxID=1381935 RepID=A0AAF0EFV8_9BASI|nr:hypothetical protein MEQU1_000257 [Malassezia equina]
MASEAGTGALCAYLEALLPVVLPVSQHLVRECLDTPTAQEAMAALAHEAGVPCLFVDEVAPTDGAREAPTTLALARQPTWTPARASALALVKRQAVLDMQAPLPAQLRVMSLQGAHLAHSTDDDTVLLETPYEALETVVHSVMAPWLDAYTEGHCDDRDDDGKASGPLVRRKLAELEASLRQVQQDVEIPQVVLRVHPAIETATAGGTAALDAIQPPSLLQEDAFINQLHADMNGWVRAVQTVTKLDRDPAAGTALQELRFWVALEGALEALERQLHAPSIALTLDVLTHAKRFHATVSFLADTGLKDCLEKVRGYHVLLKDLPLDALLTASSLDALREAQEGVLFLLTKKLRVSTYPVRRALSLVDAVGRDARESLLRLLSGTPLMRLDYAAFSAQAAAAEQLMDAWDELTKEFVYVARDLMRKRADKLIPIKASAPYTALRARLGYLQRLRRAHEELVDMAQVGEAASGGAADAADAIRAAFEGLQRMDVLDVSEQGQATLGAAEAQYNERVAQVESRLIERLQHGLECARTARERLRILAQYNRLFVRPRVRAAVQEYQTVLLQSVRADLDTLRNRFQAGYRDSDAHVAGQLRHQPDIVGAVVWLGEMERQLRVYRQRVEAALGPGWVDHVEGQRLWADSEAFLQQLDVRPLVQAWTQEMGRRAVLPQGGVLRIIRTPEGAPQLRASFEAHAFALADEAHALTMLGLPIPQALSSTAQDVRRMAPYALALDGALHTFDKVRADMAAHPFTAPLLARALSQVHASVQHVASCRWERFVDGAQAAPVDALVRAVQQLAAQAAHVRDLEREVDQQCEALRTCVYTPEAIRAPLQVLQQRIDALPLAGLVNAPLWVRTLRTRVDQVLLQRLEEALGALAAQLDAPSADVPVVHVVLRTQSVHLEPPLEAAQAHWFDVLGACIETVCGPPRLHVAPRAVDLRVRAVPTHADLLAHVPPAVLQAPLRRIQAAMGEAGAHAAQWRELQVLWDTEPDTAVDGVDDARAWQPWLAQLRAVRAFLHGPARRPLRLVHMEAAPAQARLLARYDAWEAAVHAQCVRRVSEAARAQAASMRAGRTELEPLRAVHTSTAHVVALVTRVSSLTQAVRAWAPDVEALAAVQAQLLAQHVRLPADWLYAEQLQGELSALQELLAHKQSAMDAQREALQRRMATETHAMMLKMDQLLATWARERPVSGTVPMEEALQLLEAYAARHAALQVDVQQLSEAREAFGLDALQYADAWPHMADELASLRGVWGALATIWAGVDQLKATPWSAVQVRAVRQRLEALVRECRALPSRMRTYAAYESVHGELQFLLQHISLLGDLRSDAFQTRHWRALHAQLHAPRYVASQHTLGDVWALDWHAHHGVIAAAVADAQGEYALDVYLQQVREAWSVYALEWVDYRHECLLLKGFDALSALASEHAGGLRAMAASAHYRVFEEEARLWEDRVARIQTTFELWADVQRQWVYLHGVLGTRTDMAHVLPVECARFQSISSEFLALLKKAAKASHVLDVVNLAGVRPTLERLAELLHRLQTALGEYLEKERVRFPRFYFVGDDDLLEMLGMGSDVAQVNHHLQQMWAGLHRVHLDGRRIVRIETTAHECIDLDTPIEVRDGAPVHEWLQALEAAMPRTLAAHLPVVIDALPSCVTHDHIEVWLASAPAQLLVLACQIVVVRRVEAAARDSAWTAAALAPVATWLDEMLQALGAACATEAVRARAEQLVCLLTHASSVVAALPSRGTAAWIHELRHYQAGGRVEVRIAHATLAYGFELLGARERLVQTPLTTAAYTTLTQALTSRRGGAPFGPAGTGKTETVKALGAELGRPVLVFNCDSQFDLRAMRRLLVGLGRVGAWGCFDEFNRLDEHVLSSVSQQVQAMQQALATGTEVEGHEPVPVRPTTGLFVTMNPAYAGRSRLPDNLVKLFRRVAMTQPDATLIVQVLLRVHGFAEADVLAQKMVLLFRLCAEQLSAAPHYDFGLRALKAVLVRAGRLRRACHFNDVSVMAHSVQDTVGPRLVSEDVPLFGELVRDVFPGVHAAPAPEAALREALRDEGNEAFLGKIEQLHQVLQVSHGVVLVGAAGTGKTSAWRTLLAALERMDQRPGVAHVIEPKVLTKDALYGHLDPTTREWTDGLFTHTLRRTLEPRERTKRHWIVFDGDLDPEWVETLNSVLDDNRQLTLPTGERLALPEHVRLLFEVDSVAYATRATITRCGMVWFANEARAAHPWAHVLEAVQTMPVDDDVRTTTAAAAATAAPAQVAEAIAPFLDADRLLATALRQAATLAHIMAPSEARYLVTLTALLRSAVRQVQAYAARHPDFPLAPADVHVYAQRVFVLSLVWALAGDASEEGRVALSDTVRMHYTGDLPGTLGESLLHYDVDAAPGAPWQTWATRVTPIEVDARALTTGDVVVPTIDTVRHEGVLHALLRDTRPVVLCGPPGSGKTMVLLAALRRLPDVDVVTLNLSSQTAPEAVVRTLEAHCQYEPTPSGLRLVPRAPGRRLVLFCDEINLPAPDAYGTPRVLALLRQLVTQHGFWRQRTWVTLERVHWVGACNPPTDAGRTPLPARLLRHVPVVLVGYPSAHALEQIYATLARALLRPAPALRGYAEALARGMVQYYEATQAHFTVAQHAHYVYSPRELTRWIRGLYRMLPEQDDLSLPELVARWAHEAQRVFQDRLVTPDDRAWSETRLEEVAQAVFPGVDVPRVLARPLLYSDWLSRTNERVDREALRSYAQARLRGFADEALDTELVLHDAVLDLALACDRVLQQPAGHLLLVGVAGSGRTTVARFCAWLRGLTLYSLPSAKSYDEARFDDDLRALLRRVGVRGERVCWTLDESQVAAPSRVEKLNTLLANAEVAGLFEGDEYASLLSSLREAAQREGLVVNADDELLAFFRAQIVSHLHVVLTMTPTRRDVAARAAAASPALLNRCTLVYCW